MKVPISNEELLNEVLPKLEFEKLICAEHYTSNECYYKWVNSDKVQIDYVVCNDGNKKRRDRQIKIISITLQVTEPADSYFSFNEFANKNGWFHRKLRKYKLEKLAGLFESSDL
jgi:hypothetical protein